MISKLEVRPQGSFGRWVDKVFEPLMRYLSGAPKEAPQRTHRWNNHHLWEHAVFHLNRPWMVGHVGDPKAKNFPRHLTRWGGWRRYLVLQTPHPDRHWYIGWRWPGGAGVSRVPIKGPVRVLIGPGPTEFFGIDADTNAQTQIKKIGEGHIGGGGEFAQIQLF